jgi:tetratricopeptide (TPR) repeat protein
MPLVVRTVGIALLVVLGGVYGGCAPTSDSKKNAGMLSPAQMRKTGMEDPEIRLVEQVLQLADSNRYDRALELSDSLARLTPTLPHGQYLKGRLLMEREKRFRAKAALKQAVRADSTFVPAQRWLG